jgi:hypothetical protein
LGYECHDPTTIAYLGSVAMNPETPEVRPSVSSDKQAQVLIAHDDIGGVVRVGDEVLERKLIRTVRGGGYVLAES